MNGPIYFDEHVAREEAAHFRRFGFTDEEIAARIGMDWDAWEKRLERGQIPSRCSTYRTRRPISCGRLAIEASQ